MKNTKNKEDARREYINMVKNSWTWARLTKDEKMRCEDALIRSKLFGTWAQRWEQLQNVYFAFLLALEYKPIGWREDPSEENPKF